MGTSHQIIAEANVASDLLFRNESRLTLTNNFSHNLLHSTSNDTSNNRIMIRVLIEFVSQRDELEISWGAWIICFGD